MWFFLITFPFSVTWGLLITLTIFPLNSLNKDRPDFSPKSSDIQPLSLDNEEDRIEDYLFLASVLASPVPL